MAATPALPVFQIVKTLLLCTLYIVVSGGLINFNKYLVHKGRFPHPMHLTTIHMVMSLVLCSILYAIRPSMFVGVSRSEGKRLELFKRLVPIGVCFAIMLYGSNKAYLFCSVAFLQFMKEANVVLVFSFSCLVGLQMMNRQRAVVIVWIIIGSTLCVSGDVHFALLGFLFQGMSQIAECARAVMAELVLTGEQFKLDPFSYTMFVAPICLVVLVVGSAITWQPAVATDFVDWWPLILPNACIAFVLNVVIALVIKETSAVGFIVTGIVKDIVLVVFSSVAFHDLITPKQWFSFCITLSGVFFWSFMKVAPEHQIVVSFGRLLCAEPPPKKSIDESTPLVPEPSAAKKV